MYNRISGLQITHKGKKQMCNLLKCCALTFTSSIYYIKYCLAVVGFGLNLLISGCRSCTKARNRCANLLKIYGIVRHAQLLFLNSYNRLIEYPILY